MDGGFHRTASRTLREMAEMLEAPAGSIVQPPKPPPPLSASPPPPCACSQFGRAHPCRAASKEHLQADTLTLK
eukprot:2750050-Prymnesium_polylepis.1